MTTKIVDAIIYSKGRILLVQQKSPKAHGQWSLPGGHVEDGETTKQAIVRELAEELGYKVTTGSIIKTVKHTAPVSDEGSIEITTYALAFQQSPLLLNQSELMGIGWFTLAEVEQLANSLRSPWIIPLVRNTKALKGRL